MESICTCYIIRFGEPDLRGNIVSKEAINLDNFKEMKERHEIIDFKIDDIGVKIIKKIEL